jgi:uracil-DNA glycosylase family 4
MKPSIVVENVIRWNHFEKDWIHCERCPLGQRMSRTVLYRGHLPCRILFIGEAPSEEDTTLSYAFSGQSGWLLDSMIVDAGGDHSEIGFTYVLGCWPRHEGTFETCSPKADQVKACQPRVADLLMMAQPKVIITVGQVAKKNLPKGLVVTESILNPSKIQDMVSEMQRDLSYKRTVSTLRKAFNHG